MSTPRTRRAVYDRFDDSERAGALAVVRAGGGRHRADLWPGAVADRAAPRRGLVHLQARQRREADAGDLRRAARGVPREGEAADSVRLVARASLRASEGAAESTTSRGRRSA